LTGTSLFKALLVLAAASGLCRAQNAVPVAQYNNQRTNANLTESVLNTANVNVNQFGLLFTRTLDGYSYAHPLYVPNVQIPGVGARNVVYAATLHNTVFAFDADNPAQAAPYWSVNLAPSIAFPPSVDGGYVQPEMGIMSTPAIDLTTGTLYVVAATQQGADAAMYLNALDLATGAPKFGSPALIQAQVSGSLTGYDRNPDSTITWNPNTRMQRSALLVANGTVYLGFASYGALYQYHGWVMAYSASNVQDQIAVFNTTLNGQQGGVWQSGAGFAADSDGNLYLMSGNGTYNGATDFGNSFIKLSPRLQVLDWYTPSDWSVLFQNDLDVGSSGPILLPNSNLLMGGGKQGVIDLLDSQNMGHLETSGNQPLQEFQATPACSGYPCAEIHSTALWDVSPNPIFYVWGWNDVLRGFSLIGGQFDTTPFSQSSVESEYPGGSITVSSLGSTAGTGIVWAATTQSSSLVSVVPGTLRAFDAMDLSHELWNSGLNPDRDAMGNLAKFEGPVVANGRVYVPTFSNQLDVYGLLCGIEVNSPGITGCFSINPGSASPSGSGGPDTVTVTSYSRTAAWTAVSNAAFITIVSGANGTGDGTVNYTVAPNPGLERSGAMTIAGFTFTVTQGPGATAITIQTSPTGLQFSVDGGAAQTAPQTLSLTQGEHTVAVEAQQAGAAGTQYVFTNWSDSGALSHPIPVGATAAAYTAIFQTQYLLTISASPAADGTVTPVTGMFYDSGTVVPVTAAANSGYTFTSWTGSVASSNGSSTTVTMNAPQALVANFSSNVSGPPAFFAGEDALSATIYYLQFPDGNLFGYYGYLSSSILYHQDMGYEAFIPSTGGSIYFYDFAAGHWWYTSASLFPNLYDFTLGAWIYYFPDTANPGHYTSNPRSFVNLTTQKIFTM
jgi:hypothetical protein